jgi:hypothetical protein
MKYSAFAFVSFALCAIIVFLKGKKEQGPKAKNQKSGAAQTAESTQLPVASAPAPALCPRALSANYRP